MDQQPEPVTYVCGGNHLLPPIEKFESELNKTICIASVKDGSFVIMKDCGQENTLKYVDVIQCRECGYRILYKKRTRRVIVAWSCSSSGLVLFKPLLLLVLGAFAIIGLVQAQDQQECA
ncbi:hypothetical protein F2Q70_00041996 [Brassica cretica]|uniref:Uncharacterized protein n=1 Tax=Brassica cretica TaxID=69181 RepID=A0A8S9K2H9_BRACR|nr:hypothetical protein F2Q70_00041996 [Brassica cretica]KAF2619143.1 hypothetical protein F2Q68_00042673 [Brassica cretica]